MTLSLEITDLHQDMKSFMESFGLDVVETPGSGFSHSHIKNLLLHEFLPFSVFFSACFIADINYTNLTLGFQSTLLRFLID